MSEDTTQAATATAEAPEESDNGLDDLYGSVVERLREVAASLASNVHLDALQDIYKQTVKVDVSNAVLNFKVQASEVLYRRLSESVDEPMKRLKTLTQTALDVLASKYKRDEVFNMDLARFTATNLVEITRINADLVAQALRSTEESSRDVMRAYEMLIPSSANRQDIEARALAFASMVKTLRNEADFIEEKLDEDDDDSPCECARCQALRAKQMPTA